jgi:Flp pilus assembly protein TadG
MVEFSLVSLALVPLLVGSVDVQRAVYAQNTIAGGARQAARYAGAHCVYQTPGGYYTQSSLTSYVLGQSWALDPAKLSLTVSPSDGSACPQSGWNITVTITYQYVPVTPVLSQIAGSGITLTGTATVPSQ